MFIINALSTLIFYILYLAYHQYWHIATFLLQTAAAKQKNCMQKTEHIQQWQTKKKRKRKIYCDCWVWDGLEFRACTSQHSATFTTTDRAASFDQHLMTLNAIASRQPCLLRAEQMFYQSDVAVLISH